MVWGSGTILKFPVLKREMTNSFPFGRTLNVVCFIFFQGPDRIPDELSIGYFATASGCWELQVQ
jgi:hypothetical protein